MSNLTAPTRVSLIGLGRAGKFHLQSLRLIGHAELDRVYDSDTARSSEVSAAFGCKVAKSLDEAVAAETVDAVIVATPTDTHFDYVVAALEAGKAVLTEKPLGRKLQHIDHCFALAKKNASPLFVAFQRRFDPSFVSLIRDAHAGRIGDLQFVRSVSRDNPVPSIEYIRTSGGIFHDCMVHDLDMICTITQQRPTRLASFASSMIPEIDELDDFDNVAAALHFPSGITATIDVTRQSAYGYDQRIEAFGSRGMLQAENRHQTTVIHGGAEGFVRPPVDHSFPTRYREAYRAELECFVQCVRGECAVPISHRDVRDNFLLASGLEIAARENRVVTFDEIEKHPSVSEGGEE